MTANANHQVFSHSTCSVTLLSGRDVQCKAGLFSGVRWLGAQPDVHDGLLTGVSPGGEQGAEVGQTQHFLMCFLVLKN